MGIQIFFENHEHAISVKFKSTENTMNLLTLLTENE
jgi:hypothetical protein